MAAPVYTQQEALMLIRLPKFVQFDAWENRWAGRETTNEVRHRIEAVPQNDSSGASFVIESCHCTNRMEVSFTLLGKLIGRPLQAICRYEMQLGKHRNPSWFMPRYIQARELHCHDYNERAIRQGLSWDACAEPIGPQCDRIQQAIERLTPLFLENLKIEIHDPDVRKSLFGQ